MTNKSRKLLECLVNLGVDCKTGDSERLVWWFVKVRRIEQKQIFEHGVLQQGIFTVESEHIL